MKTAKRLRVYAGDDPLQPGHSLTLSRDETHHLCTVLRARRGQDLEVFNAKGELAIARLKDIAGREAVVDILEIIAPPEEIPYRLTLCPALVKDAAWRLILEKSVELGVSDICPIWTRYCVPTLPEGPDREGKQKKWQQTILGAVKQSHRISVPRCAPAMTFGEALQQAAAQRARKILLFEGGEGAPLSQAINAASADIRAGAPIWLFLGPEGGFHPDEVSLARESGVTICALGPLILRAETAAIASLAAIHASMGTF